MNPWLGKGEWYQLLRIWRTEDFWMVLGWFGMDFAELEIKGRFVARNIYKIVYYWYSNDILLHANAFHIFMQYIYPLVRRDLELNISVFPYWVSSQGVSQPHDSWILHGRFSVLHVILLNDLFSEFWEFWLQNIVDTILDIVAEEFDAYQEHSFFSPWRGFSHTFSQRRNVWDASSKRHSDFGGEIWEGSPSPLHRPPLGWCRGKGTMDYRMSLCSGY